MRRDGYVQPTVTNTLINLSSDFETAKVWLDQMRRSMVFTPDTVFAQYAHQPFARFRDFAKRGK